MYIHRTYPVLTHLCTFSVRTVSYRQAVASGEAQAHVSARGHANARGTTPVSTCSVVRSTASCLYFLFTNTLFLPFYFIYFSRFLIFSPIPPLSSYSSLPPLLLILSLPLLFLSPPPLPPPLSPAPLPPPLSPPTLPPPLSPPTRPLFSSSSSYRLSMTTLLPTQLDP